MTRWRIDIDDAVLERASARDPEALNAVARQLMTPVYNLAMRFFGQRADAQDAAQEALLRVLRGLPSFRAESAFSTWAYRVAVNSLLTSRRRQLERLSTAEGAEALELGLLHHAAHGAYQGPDAALLADEVRLSCTTALLVCLSRPLRMAYILGEIVGLNGPQAAAILEIEPATFRKRLSLARQTVRGFLAPRCGLVDARNPCRCDRQIGYDLEVGWIARDDLNYARDDHLRTMRALETTFDDARDLYATHPHYAPDERWRHEMLALLGRLDELPPTGRERSG